MTTRTTNHTIGRPRLPEGQRGEQKGITLKPAEWAVLAEADPDGNPCREAVRRLRATIGGATRLTYELDDLHDLRRGIANGEHLGGRYRTISAEDQDGRSAEIVTNARGEGLFWWSNSDCCYHQSTGTAQFSIRTWSDNRARRELRRVWEAKYGDGRD